MSEKKQNLLSILKNGQSNLKETFWPGTDEKILIRPATENDHLQASIAADQFYSNSKVKISTENIGAYCAEVSTRMLNRCILDPETKEPICGIAEFRDLLTPEIKTILEDELDTFCDMVSPSPERLSDEEFDSLIQNIKKKPEETVGNVSSIFTARRLIITLVRQSMI